MEIDNAAVVALFVWQALQTVQLVAVSRGMAKVSKTLMPPPLAVPPPPLSAASPFCHNCGTLTNPSELRGGLCPECLGTNPTDRPYADPHAEALRFRRRRK